MLLWEREKKEQPVMRIVARMNGIPRRLRGSG
jgi:hypothetical protein